MHVRQRYLRMRCPREKFSISKPPHSREVSCAKVNIKPNEIYSGLELLQKVVKAKPDAIFDELEGQFDATAPASVTDHYNKNWHSIRH